MGVSHHLAGSGGGMRQPGWLVMAGKQVPSEKREGRVPLEVNESLAPNTGKEFLPVEAGAEESRRRRRRSGGTAWAEAAVAAPLGLLPHGPRGPLPGQLPLPHFVRPQRTEQVAVGAGPAPTPVPTGPIGWSWGHQRKSTEGLPGRGVGQMRGSWDACVFRVSCQTPEEGGFGCWRVTLSQRRGRGEHRAGGRPRRGSRRA